MSVLTREIRIVGFRRIAGLMQVSIQVRIEHQKFPVRQLVSFIEGMRAFGSGEIEVRRKQST